MAPIFRSILSLLSLSLSLSFANFFPSLCFINRFITWRDRPPRDKETRSSVHSRVRSQRGQQIYAIYIYVWLVRGIAANCAT